MSATQDSPRHWKLLLAAATMLLVTMGARQTGGLFVQPIHANTGIDIASISFALAIGQLVWGAVQPLFGAIADRHGATWILILGGVLAAFGMVLTPLLPSAGGLLLTMGVLAPAGAAAGSFSILIAATARRIDAKQRSFAAGVINAGSSLGQFAFAPLVQLGITTLGWMGAMYALAVTPLLALPLVRVLHEDRNHAPAVTAQTSMPGLREQLRIAFSDRSYLLLHASFFTCGVHIGFLVTHLPGEVALCGLSANVASISIALIGLCNIAGSLAIGVLGQRYRMKYMLALMYASRTVLIALYLVAPPTPTTFYLFSAGLGLSWLATVPPTAGLIGKLFGARYLGTLFGLTLLTHQAGAFLGAWLGGIALERFGNYHWMWYADMLLASLAGLANLPIREPRTQPATA